MIESVPYGVFVGEIIQLPDKVAHVWLKELGEDEKLNERQYISTEESTFYNDELRELIIYRSATGYHLSLHPNED